MAVEPWIALMMPLVLVKLARTGLPRSDTVPPSAIIMPLLLPERELIQRVPKVAVMVLLLMNRWAVMNPLPERGWLRVRVAEFDEEIPLPDAFIRMEPVPEITVF